MGSWPEPSLKSILRSSSEGFARARRDAASSVIVARVEPSPITFARGAPSLDIIPVDDLRTAAQAAFASDPKGAFSYGTAGGYGPLRDWIAERHSGDREQGIATTGSIQADPFLFQLMVEPGDTG